MSVVAQNVRRRSFFLANLTPIILPNLSRTMTRVAKRADSSKIIDLSVGWPNPKLLPPHQLSNAAQIVLASSELSRTSLKYAPDDGYLPLREVLAKWLQAFYEPAEEIRTERICITGGASQNLACVLQTFTDPIYTRNVWMVAPTYFLACRIIDDSGFAGRMKGVPEDEEGIDIDYLSKHIEQSEQQAVRDKNTEPKLKTRYPWRKTFKHIIYAVPTFANPSGRVMTMRRREALIRLARKYDALIVTDDVYDMLQWPIETQPEQGLRTKAVLPRLVDVDRALDGGPTSEWGNAMSNGSFSKIVAPGCRTGWAEATPKLAWALSQCGSSRSGGAPSQLAASMLHQMIANGDVDKHIRHTLLQAYEKRYKRMMQAVQAWLYPLGVRTPQPGKEVAGGYFIWLTLPKPLIAEDIRKKAQRDENLVVISGPKFRVQGDEENESARFDQQIRLCFSYEEFELLDEGVERLAKVIKSSLSG